VGADADEGVEGRIPPPPIDVVEAAVSFSRQLVRRIDRDLVGQGLTWSQFNALFVIERCRGWIHAAAVGQRMGVSRQAASALFVRLDERGFLKWLDEGWIKSVQLTGAGHEAASLAFAAISDTLAAIQRLGVDERWGLITADRAIGLELARPPSGLPWYWDQLPEHVRENPPPNWL
jgi:DNA-binding MarR family transcriptional regulator